MQPDTKTTAADAPVEQWALLEIMGHEKLAGKISEALIAGTKMLKVEVPATDKLPSFERYFNTSAFFSITPVPESVARTVANNLQKTAVTGLLAYGYSAADQQQMREALGLPAPAAPRSYDYDERSENTANYDNNQS